VKEGKSTATERARHPIEGNQMKNTAGQFDPGGRIMGARDLGPSQFRAGAVRTPPTTGCDGRRCAFEDGLES
jgi:hypothetical protein